MVKLLRYSVHATVRSAQRCHIAQPTSRLVRSPPLTSTSLSLSLSLSLLFLPSLSLSVSLLTRNIASVGLINGWCQKRCQSILCLFGFIWTSGVVVRGDGGMKGGGERGLKGRKGYIGGEVVTEGGARGEKKVIG